MKNTMLWLGVCGKRADGTAEGEAVPLLTRFFSALCAEEMKATCNRISFWPPAHKWWYGDLLILGI